MEIVDATIQRSRWMAVAGLALAAVLHAGKPVTAAETPFSGTRLADYLERALDANPGLKAFEDRHRGALADVEVAGTLPDPRLQVTHFVESVQTRTGTQENVFVLSQSVPWFGKLRQRETAATAEAEAVYFLWQARQLGLVREVAGLYFDYAFTGRSFALTGENLELLELFQPIVEERVRAGGDLNALLRLQVEIERLRDRLKSLEQTRAAQSARLAALLALPDADLLPWPEWQPPEPLAIDGPALHVALEANNPVLAMLDRKIASAEARRVLARLERFPDLMLGVNYIQLDGYAGSTLPEAGRDPWGVSVGISLPIWEGRNRARDAGALAARTAAAHERRDRENRLHADLDAAIARHDDAMRRLELYGGKLLGLAQQALEITRTSYEAGRATVLEVIDSERSLLDLQLQYWRAAAEAWQSRVAIQTLVNHPVAGRPRAASAP
ncbi:MAG: TolC family protein [Verrucomicrobia bacterium]|nr:MAG: TolC family protein [Verrucomicrobiota bacterium]